MRYLKFGYSSLLFRMILEGGTHRLKRLNVSLDWRLTYHANITCAYKSIEMKNVKFTIDKEEKLDKFTNDLDSI